MTQHALGSDGEPSDAASHKDSGKEEQGKAGIPRNGLVYTGPMRGLERREKKRRSVLRGRARHRCSRGCIQQ